MAKNIYIFKITLNHITPPIWRRIAIPSSATFNRLHQVIQEAMGWTSSHLHEFVVRDVGGKVKIGVPDKEEPLSKRALSDKKVKLTDYFIRAGERATYLYDFGDGWEHELILEAVAEGEKGRKYPCCLEGARACPPEDCGGPWGYDNLVKALADPNHPEHSDMRSWVGPRFDPEQFERKLEMDES